MNTTFIISWRLTHIVRLRVPFIIIKSGKAWQNNQVTLLHVRHLVVYQSPVPILILEVGANLLCDFLYILSGSLCQVSCFFGNVSQTAIFFRAENTQWDVCTWGRPVPDRDIFSRYFPNGLQNRKIVALVVVYVSIYSVQERKRTSVITAVGQIVGGISSPVDMHEMLSQSTSLR